MRTQGPGSAGRGGTAAWTSVVPSRMPAGAGVGRLAVQGLPGGDVSAAGAPAAGTSAAGGRIVDSFTPSALDPDTRAHLLDHLREMRGLIASAPVGTTTAEEEMGLLELTDAESDRGLELYEQHRDKTRAGTEERAIAARDGLVAAIDDRITALQEGASQEG